MNYERNLRGSLVMDVFLVDKLIAALIYKLMNDSVVQFSVIAGIGAIVSIIFPDKSKSSRGNKK